MIKLIFVILSSFLFVLNVDAYTAQDIISLTNSVHVCDDKTSNIVSGMRKSYTILLNEREISDDDLNVIYSNISKVITIVNKYKVCKLSDKDKIPSDEFAKLYSLYKETNDIFVKAPIKGTTTTNSKVNSDVNDNSGSNKCIVYARNYCFKLAKELGIKYFAQFDDDYIELAYRYPQDGKLKICNIREFDKIVDICIDFLEDTGALTIAFAQHGDFIGGVQNKFLQDRVKRKAMNSFFCKTDNPFTFDGRINEDVNAYVGLGRTGNLFLTFCDVSLKQKHTQQNKGGMTETYNEGGTYLKSFYTVMANPSCVKICIMGDKYLRIHHRVNWNNAVPKIISDKYKK